MKKQKNARLMDRRDFLKFAGIGAGAAMIGMQPWKLAAQAPEIQGFDDFGREAGGKVWVPVSDRKIRVGLIGYGVCKFSAEFGFQNHPNVEVVAVSDLIPERCAELARVTGCNKTYPSLEELIKDKNVEAVYIATDAPSHARHSIEALRHGKHVAVAVPAVYGSLDEAQELLDTVKSTGLKYMMFETSMFRENLWAMRQLYKAGALGQLAYAEGEYWHYSRNGIDSFRGWRHGMPPLFYPTHNDAYYIGVTDGTYLDVSCIGLPSKLERFQPGQNAYNNRFGTETAFYKTSEGGCARSSRSDDTVGHGYGSETGRVRGTEGSYYDKYEGLHKELPDLTRPPLPEGMPAGGHGGSHGRLTDEFITSILLDRKPLVDVVTSLNMSVPGIIAHESALRDGEWLKIPQYSY